MLTMSQAISRIRLKALALSPRAFEDTCETIQTRAGRLFLAQSGTQPHLLERRLRCARARLTEMGCTKTVILYRERAHAQIWLQLPLCLCLPRIKQSRCLLNWTERVVRRALLDSNLSLSILKPNKKYLQSRQICFGGGTCTEHEVSRELQ